MASTGSVFILSIVCPSLVVASSFISLECDKTTTGQFGHQSLLTCVIKPPEGSSDVVVRFVKWTKTENKLSLLRCNGQMTSEPGYSFAETSWNNKNMNVSLLIRSTKVEDDGAYKCDVATNSGTGSGVITLKVAAKYSPPTVELIQEGNGPKAVRCSADGGFPAGELRWYDSHRTDWTKSSEERKTKMDNGLFRLSSNLLLSPNSMFPPYTCVVFNSSRGKEAEATLEVPSEPEGLGAGSSGSESSGSSKIVAPLVVIGSLIVGLLALLLYRRRSQQIRRMSTTPLMGPERVPANDPDVEEGPQEEDSSDLNDMA